MGGKHLGAAEVACSGLIGVNLGDKPRTSLKRETMRERLHAQRLWKHALRDFGVLGGLPTSRKVDASPYPHPFRVPAHGRNESTITNEWQEGTTLMGDE